MWWVFLLLVLSSLPVDSRLDIEIGNLVEHLRATLEEIRATESEPLAVQRSALEYVQLRASQPPPPWRDVPAYLGDNPARSFKDRLRASSARLLSPPSLSTSRIDDTPEQLAAGVGNSSLDVDDCRPESVAFASDEEAVARCCHYRLGEGLLDVWRAQAEERCSPKPTHQFNVQRTQLGPTSVQCRLRPDSEPGVPENLCTATNIAINITRLAQHLSHEPQPRVGHEIPQVAFFQATCTPQLPDDTVGNGMDLWLRHAVDGSAPAQAACRAIVEHSVLFMFRWHTANVYHIHEEFAHTFVGSALLDVPAGDLQLVVTDRRQKGLLFDLWSQVFSAGHPVLDLQSLLERSNASSPDAGDLLCFRKAWFNVHSGVSILSREKRLLTPCRRSPLVAGLADMVRDGFGVARALTVPRPATIVSHNHNHSNSPNNPDNSNSPNNSNNHNHSNSSYNSNNQNHNNSPNNPDNSNSPNNSNDDTLRRDLLDLVAATNASWSRLPWSEPPLRVTVLVRDEALGRPIPRQDELLSFLSRLSPFVEQRSVDFARLSTRDQIATASQTDLLVGVHGAGLVFCLYQPDHGGLLELEHSTRMGDKTYPSLAQMRGLYQRTVPVALQTSPALFDHVVDALVQVHHRRSFSLL